VLEYWSIGVLGFHHSITPPLHYSVFLFLSASFILSGVTGIS